MYTTVCLDDVPSEPSDFFPLSVHYQERFSAAGRTRYAIILSSIIWFTRSVMKEAYPLCY